MDVKLFLGGDPTADASWSPVNVPVTGDIVYLRELALDLTVADQSAIQLAELHIEQSFTGKTSSASAYWRIGADKVFIGEHYGYGSPSGSPRLLLDLGTDATEIVVRNTAGNSADATQPPLRIKAVNVANAIYLRKGKAGIATNDPSEVATFALVDVAHSGNVTSDAEITIGPGVTLTTLHKTGGNAILRAAATTVTNHQGSLLIVGTGAIAALTVAGGNVYPESRGTITTLNADGGQIDASRSNVARAWTTLAAKANSTATIKYDPAVVTVANKLAPAGPVTIALAAA